MTQTTKLEFKQQFALNDRLANYGDGVFTTMHVVGGYVGLLQRHIDRLVHDALKLGIAVDADEVRWNIANAMTLQDTGVLKVLIGAGCGGRGYARDASAAPTIAVSWHDIPTYYEQWREQGITLGTVPITLAKQPLLAGLKHANRLEQILVKRALLTCDFDDCIVTDELGNVVEASAANVFWLDKGQWYTPAIDLCGVNGVMRQFILSHHHVEVGAYDVSALCQAQAVFLSNALMHLVPVKRADILAAQVHFDLTPVLALQQTLRQAFESECACA